VGLSRLKTVRPVARLREGRNDWYRIENKASQTADVYIYDEIGYFGVTASDFVQDLATVTAKNIVIHLNSPGGDAFDGLAIYNAIKQHPSPTKCIIEGLAASAASFIAMAGDTVEIARNAQVMIHDASGVCIGNAADMKQTADLLDKLSENIADIYAQKAGGDVADWRAKMKAETWFSAQEACDCGIADSMNGNEARTDSTTASWDLSIYAGPDHHEEPIASSAEPEPVAECDFDFTLLVQTLKEGIR